ncbi:MAG: choice-of-anchor D domain-containing protein [Nitrospiraceae bacterium]|nr:choice-of-anchor D domain-containing protein [Nitrospiraceae bacterium]
MIRRLCLTLLMAIMYLPAIAVSAQAGCPRGIAAYWNLNETSGNTFTDIISGSNATCSGTACPSFSQGKIEGALDFNGSNGLSVTNVTPFNWGAQNSFSVELWMKTNSPGTCSGGQVLVGRTGASGPGWTLECADGGQAAFALSDSNGTSAAITGTSVISDGHWHHIMAVRDASAGTVSLYVDNALQAQSQTDFNGGFQSQAQLTIGWINRQPYNYFKGAIDDVAVYSTAAPASQALGHYYIVRGYCDMCSSPIKIMPLGDSITQGLNGTSGDYTGYREDLKNLLLNDGFYTHFVGSQQDGCDSLFSDCNHEGHPGYTDGPQGTGTDLSENIETNLISGSDWLKANPPDIVLLHIGTNYFDTNGTGYDTSADPVSGILDNIASFDPDITVLLAKIILPATSETYPGQNNVITLNENIASMAGSRIASGISPRLFLVDQQDALNYNCDSNFDNCDLYSEIHPNASGYTKMAAVWFKQLNTFLPYCGQTVSSSPFFHDFGNTGTGGPSLPEPFTISNQGNSPLAISGISLSGSESGQFTITSDKCSGQALKSSGTCIISVAFAPQNTGSKSAILSVSSNDQTSPQLKIQLTGNGVSSPAGSLSPASYDFGSVTSGSTATEVFTVINQGSSGLTVNSVSISGANAKQFAIQSDGCTGKSLASSGSCQTVVSFTPGPVGNASAQLSFSTNAGVSQALTASLTGAGLSSSTSNPPAKAGLISPGDNQGGLDTTVTFWWTPSMNQDGGSVNYKLYVSPNSNFSNCTPINVPGSGQKHAIPLAAAAGLAISSAVMVINRNRRLSLLLGIAVFFMVLGSCSGGGSGDGGGGSSNGGGAGDGGNVSATVQGLQSGTPYYWKIVSTNSAGQSSESDTWTFDTN